MVDTPALEAGGREARASSSLAFGTKLALVAELVDAEDLSPSGAQAPCWFESSLEYQNNWKVTSDGSEHRLESGWTFKRWGSAPQPSAI